MITDIDAPEEWTEEYCEELRDPHECPACEGPLVPLGNLGRRGHYRCRSCGIQLSVELVTEVTYGA